MGAHGLSPRVRGSPSGGRDRQGVGGSIPAGAGEPCGEPECWAPSGVYPRGCGGAFVCGRLQPESGGLSPRVRGSRAGGEGDELDRGSIPAGAGEPRPTCRPAISSSVYPRGCGGAPQGGVSPGGLRGLSPRVRGSPMRRVSRAGGTRSIPAGAGEPTTSCLCPALSTVYPRGCGGARYREHTPTRRRGLSPRVRGSPSVRLVVSVALGSIPAGAGEPTMANCEAYGHEVYPRGCGGASPWARRQAPTGGLSPRVRGSHTLPALSV